MTDEIPTTGALRTRNMVSPIPSFDWAGTPLGPVEGWPQPLRSAAAMIRAASSPVAVYWGPDLILLYNDAWSDLMGVRHVDYLGKPARLAFLSALGHLSPLLEAVLAGRGSRRADDVRLSSRSGEDKWYTFSLEPLPLEDERIGGVLSVAFETTEGVLARQTLRDNTDQQACLLRLADAIGPLNDPREIMSEATRVLGEHLGLTRAAYGEVEADGEHIRFERNYVKPGTPVISGRFRMAEFGSSLTEALSSGRIITVADVASTPVLGEEEREAYLRLGIASLMGVPLIKGGRLAANISMHCDAPRHWSALDISLARETAERTWAAVERARAEAAMQESEEQYRSLFQAMDQGYALCKLVRDEKGEVCNYRFLQINKAFETYTGKAPEDVVGRLRSEVIPGDDQRTLAALSRVSATGMAMRLEYYNRGLDRWYDVGLYPRSQDRFAALFTDITDRKRQEKHLREHEARHRADLEREVRDRTAELKQSRDLLKATMDSSVDMIQVFEAIRDTSGKIVDFRWLLNNHTSESKYGSAEGESLLQRNPGVVVEGIFDSFSRVTETGIPEQAERHYAHEQFDGWFYQSVVKLGDGVATTTKEISEWKAAQQEVLRLRDEIAQARLRESEERLKQFGEASQDILWIRDVETLQWQYLTPAFETIYGISREEALAGDNLGSWLDLIIPEDRMSARAAIEEIARGAHVSFEYRISRPSDGEIRWLKDTGFPILGEDGEIRFIGGIGTDVTEAKLTHERLQQSEERLRNALEVGKLGMWDWNVKTGDVTWSDEHFRMEGYAVGEIVPSYEAWAARIHPDDREATESALKEAMERREDYLREFRVLHPDGNTRWLYGRGRFFYDDEAGQPMRMVGAMIDVTDRKEWEDRLQVLVLELQHRTRNLMGVVRSLANSTLRSSSSLPEFRATFQDRLAALARVNGLLSRLNEGDRIHLEELLAAELLALGVSDAYRDRITLEGPHGVRLRSGTVQTFALALHELATNAVKYGAFATPEGSLVIRWKLSRQEGKTYLDLEWKERGVRIPSADSAYRRTGYGRELIERALPYQLKAKTTYVLEKDGVHCTIMMPISER